MGCRIHFFRKTAGNRSKPRGPTRNYQYFNDEDQPPQAFRPADNLRARGYRDGVPYPAYSSRISSKSWASTETFRQGLATFNVQSCAKKETPPVLVAPRETVWPVPLNGYVWARARRLLEVLSAQ